MLRSDLAARKIELDDARATLSGLEVKMKQLDDTVSALSREKAQVDNTIAEVAASKQKGSSATRGMVKRFFKVVQSATYRLQALKASAQGDLKRAQERQKRELALQARLQELEHESIPAQPAPPEEVNPSHILPGTPVTGFLVDDTLT